MSIWIIRAGEDGQPRMARSTREFWMQDIRDNPGAIYEIKRRSQESGNIRRFFEGGIVPLFAFYHGKDWRTSAGQEWARNHIKLGFNYELDTSPITGEMIRMPKSTVGKLAELIHEVEEYLFDNYHMPEMAVNTKAYKKWHAEMTSALEGPDDWITFLLEQGVLTIPSPADLPAQA